ncbi:sn-glycerol-3-phosphate ABC transporter ATP-binding protein UgpC [Pikeienuella piscinae]|uniref:sn-glycerol-3-phosphate ABC transporter ATP-binding protein UgpC n=1 Tax=Pikeienuella piscinae TaxID=2748098 RepID=A0A7L5BVY3_9RHOB|nr:sn-glycerol-3-phosphate ABC transporter ATP-binding protein UgpC [Pikeienuella piscinae]QIE54988.1 sn-glycerol-3-phosphate ABC transporter ATP-binding protein UgpC [Pikeienuella piscinae]
MGSVKLSSVQKKYDDLEVVRDVDIDIEDGEFVVFIGPSGSGKSTLLRMIAGLEAISGGQILIDERVVNDIPPKDRDIAMVFQNYALYPHKTVAANMAFALKMRKQSRAEIKRRVERAAEILDLGGLLERYPRQLSGGQRQRVAMGRAIVRDPKVFLFDEPLSNLDAKLRVAMRAEIKQLHQQLGTTTIYVTHDQIEAMTMADKVVVLRDGVVEQVGAPIDLYDFPANRFVAEFIGSPSMNIFDGAVVGDDRTAFRTSGGVDFPIVAHPRSRAGQPMLYGIRPEHLSLSDQGVPAVVTLVEPTGSEVHVTAKVGSDTLVAISRERKPLRVGELVHFSPSLEAAHLFERDSGIRLA